MDDERHVDGNALAGVFHDVFGREMTHESGCCSQCGAANQLGAARVYRAAGDVLRCPNCGSVLMVIVPDASGMRVSFESMRWLRISMSNARE
jgi:DNA-directed RNA polymerase subunit RPC12/RpoP